MSDLDDIRAEVAALRQDVTDLQAATADTRVLAALADRDAAGVRAGQAGIVSTLNALRETQIEQGQVLSEHGRVLGALVVGQQQHNNLLGQLTTAVGSLAEGQARQGEILARHDAALDGLTTAVGALADGQERQAETLAEILRRLPAAGA